MSDDLGQDLERLVDIAEQVLTGVPIEEFELGEDEIHFVVGYCRGTVDETFDGRAEKP